jgi:uncharacterized coiled-coil DUF342 family protein
MSKNFNYPNTCPRIDKNIKNFQSDLTTHLNALVEELNPMFYSTNESWRFIEGFSDIIYNSAEPCFEDTRQSNSDMRDEVEKVIDDIIEERDEYKRLSEEWESEAEQKDTEIENLREEIEELKERLNDL